MGVLTPVPPSSPPINLRRRVRTLNQTRKNMVKSRTENAREPLTTVKWRPLLSWYIAPINHASPTPRKTLTALLPVIFPMAGSAVGSSSAAILLANVSGIDVPAATKLSAVTVSARPIVHPIPGIAVRNVEHVRHVGYVIKVSTRRDIIVQHVGHERHVNTIALLM